MAIGRDGAQEANIIIVKGEGTVSAEPDTAKVTVGVTTEQKDLVEAQQQNARDAANLVKALLGSGIPPENIRTSDYRIESVYDYKEGAQLFRGYKITHLFQVKTSDLGKVGALVDNAVQNGANYVSDIQFTNSRKDDLYNEALELAVKNAAQKAVTISQAIGANLNPVPLTVTEGFQQPIPYSEYHTPMVKGISTTTPIQPGQLLIEADITVKYRFEAADGSVANDQD
ncbi:SIMPL domain-containing protein [Bacillus sp. B-jedd]|uniref:SIMPL domain-containing protein n=1 Tax=Bacillus sp. B-jedd TaxID=1476857 RepID=UPI0005156450|nr:SIMPL domain-containing protein [Bacillus sp. B-jedd]CEG27809.1 outer membrane protein [Bacillus sp. B-jedd]